MLHLDLHCTKSLHHIDNLVNIFQSDHMTLQSSHIILTSLLIHLIWSHDSTKSSCHINKLVDTPQSDHMTVWNENSIDEYWKDFLNHLMKLYLSSLSLSYINLWSDARTEQANPKRLPQISFLRSGYTSLSHDSIRARSGG